MGARPSSPEEPREGGPISARAAATAGREAWPDLSLDTGAFEARVTAVIANAPDPDATLARMRPDDFYLASACATGDAAAIARFEAKYANVIERAVQRFARTRDRQDELRQLLRERLFVAKDGAEPRIATYTGQGFLENWLRVAAVRAFMNAGRGQKRETPASEDTLAVLADGGDLELEFLKVHYRGAFRRAFAHAVESLEPSDRLVLRLAVVRGLSCDDVAATLGVHRATAARRIARAKQLLVDGTRKELAGLLRVGDNELASILRLFETNLDVSISRLLSPGDEE